MPPITAILFDAWGTLWYVPRNPGEVWLEALSELGLNVSLHQVTEAEKNIKRRFTPEWNVMETSGTPNRLAAIERYWERYDMAVLGQLGIEVDLKTLRQKVIPKFAALDQLYPESKPVLTELSRMGYRMAIVSNGVYQERSAKSLGIDSYFGAIVGSVHVGFKKPSAEIFHLALSSLESKPENIVMVGDDRELDVVGAQGVGITGLHLIRESKPPHDANVISDLWGLVKFLKVNMAA